MTSTNKPSHGVYIVEGEGDKAFWTKIGAAWPQSDEGFSIQLTALPITGRLVVRKFKADAAKTEQGQ